MPEADILSRLAQLSRIQEEALPRLNGLFPSFRWHPWGYRREDFSAYFTAGILQGLLSLEEQLFPKEKKLLEEIRAQACRGLARFRNSHGLDRYNFWGTKPAGHFPNGYLLRHFPGLRPPDDADDSVMIYQIQQRNQEDALWLKKHIDENANGSRAWVTNCPEEYRELRAWCTFFCRDMPLGFDACVISNILYFNRFYGFEVNFREQDSIRYLKQMLENRDHLRRPQELAPYYPEPATILFHLARLIGTFEIEGLSEKRRQMEREIEKLLQSPLRKTERILLQIAWIRMSSSLPPQYSGKDLKEEFAYFVLPLSQEYEGGFLRWLARKRITHIRFACPAHVLALEIEKAVLLRSLQSGSRNY